MHKHGEAFSAFPGHNRTPSRIAEHFRSFYLGFTLESIIWFAYRDDDTNFETIFSFADLHEDDENMMVFVEMIKTRLLPSCVFGKDPSSTYEFYNPLVSARQLGFGQLPIGLYSPIRSIHGRLFPVVPIISVSWISSPIPPPLILVHGNFLVLPLLFSMSGGQNSATIFSVYPQEFTLRS
jgi:hypothetical protein